MRSTRMLERMRVAMVGLICAIAAPAVACPVAYDPPRLYMGGRFRIESWQARDSNRHGTAIHWVPPRPSFYLYQGATRWYGPDFFDADGHRIPYSVVATGDPKLVRLDLAIDRGTIDFGYTGDRYEIDARRGPSTWITSAPRDSGFGQDLLDVDSDAVAFKLVSVDGAATYQVNVGQLVLEHDVVKIFAMYADRTGALVFERDASAPAPSRSLYPVAILLALLALVPLALLPRAIARIGARSRAT